MSSLPSYLLNLAGEYRVCSELNKRGIFATLTYGNRKCADVYAIDDERQRVLKIEVKTTQKRQFVTSIGQKGLLRTDRNAPDFWVLFQLTSPQADNFAERFFVLTHEEIWDIQKARNDLYSEQYKIRHNGDECDPKRGVDNVPLESLGQYEDQWFKIIERLK